MLTFQFTKIQYSAYYNNYTNMHITGHYDLLTRAQYSLCIGVMLSTGATGFMIMYVWNQRLCT